MSIRFILSFIAAMVLLFTALSTGSAPLLLGGVVLLLLLLLGVVSVLLARHTLQISTLMNGTMVRRGEDVALTVEVRHGSILPIGPIALEMAATPDAPERTLQLNVAGGKHQRVSLTFHAAHVGLTTPGVKAVQLRDMFGFFSLRMETAQHLGDLLVLPASFPVTELKFSPGDSGLETMARATEDASNPSDIRPYQPGDALKKIHWKLSLRKREIMVRRFEEPVLPEALIIMDCSPPPAKNHPEVQKDLKDSLLETAASVMERLMPGNNTVRLPLTGNYPVECDKSMGLPLILENLARVDFSETDKFERVLLLETRRLRKVGATVVITARLNGAMVDVMTRMRKMGPTLRLYLVTFTPDDPRAVMMVGKLQSAGVEVSYVTPMKM